MTKRKIQCIHTFITWQDGCLSISYVQDNQKSFACEKRTTGNIKVWTMQPFFAFPKSICSF